MNRDELKVLMAAASAVDRFFPAADPDVLDVWHNLLCDVPADVAAEALRAHYRATSETIAPADIVEVWRFVRRDELEQRALAEALAPARPELVRPGVELAFEMLAERKALRSGVEPQAAVAKAKREAAARREFLSHPCPYCRALPGRPCTDGLGRELKRSPAHPTRLAAAQVAAREKPETLSSP